MKIKTVHIVVAALVIIAAVLAYESISSDICPYLRVSEVTTEGAQVGEKVKILGSVVSTPTGWGEEGLDFELTDGNATIAVTYTGSLSQNVKKGQEVGAIGVLDASDHVTATKLDIKCASKYE